MHPSYYHNAHACIMVRYATFVQFTVHSTLCCGCSVQLQYVLCHYVLQSQQYVIVLRCSTSVASLLTSHWATGTGGLLLLLLK